MGQARIVRSVVLDATALTEAAHEGAQLRIQLRRAIKRGAAVYTSAATLTEVLRGHPRDALTYRLLLSVKIRVIDADLGQAAGARIGRTRVCGNVTLDSLVAEVASSLPRPVVVFTADDKDLKTLVDPDVMVLNIAA